MIDDISFTRTILKKLSLEAVFSFEKNKKKVSINLITLNKQELKKNNLTVSVILVAIFISYIIGFYFNEDSAGGGKIDYINHNESHTFLNRKV